MQTEDFGKILSEMYFGAANGESVTMIHLFGVTYATQIKNSGTNASQIVKASGIPKSYVTEVSKGIKLAKFVVPK